jgi:hypothetical protein
LEDGLDDEGISVTGDFEEVFSSIGVWIRPKSEDNLIEFFVLESDMGGLRRTRGYRFARKLLGDGTGFWARYANQGESRDPWRCGAGSNGIFFKSHKLLIFAKWLDGCEFNFWGQRWGQTPRWECWSAVGEGGMKDGWVMRMS